MIPRIETAASSFRVFYGFKRPDLDEADFLRELGTVFMPGTPLMVRDLGLAAYIPALVPANDRAMPDEVAIIAYASREVYDRARNQSITGRMYTHTHLAVFDMGISRSQHPEALGPAGRGVTAFYCTGRAADWQADGDVLVWVGARDAPDPSAPATFITAVRSLVPSLQAAGVIECVGQVADSWASLWLLLDGFGQAAAQPLESIVGRGIGGMTQVMREMAGRLVWQDAPPAAPSVRPGAWSYIFVRDSRHFLR